ncbi:MAG: hypothetical protein AAB452_01475 [Patescibacteria group bacterium]
MENETQNQATESSSTVESVVEPVRKNYLLPASILISAAMLTVAWVYTTELRVADDPQKANIASDSEKAALEAKVLPSEGVILPVRWGDLGAKMVSTGVIDRQKLEALYAGRGGLSKSDRQLIEDANNGNLKINAENSGMILNLLWALGLGTKNDILEKGPMMTYSGADRPAEALAKAGNFASTGGWTLANGEAMSHYSQHHFVVLTPEQQEIVERVSKNIYRPCCNNPTHFPDCNHGMAMLGFLELMASQGVSEKEMYKAALQVNAYWFPETYLTIAQYLASKGIEWAKADPQELLGVNYSSGSGYQQIRSQVTVPVPKSSGGCGV